MLEFHPIANCFPLLEGEQFDTLVASVRKNGVLEAICLYEDKILDGRNRYRAAQIVGCAEKLEAESYQYDGDDPVEHVTALNLARRHMEVSARAMAAAKLEGLKRGAPRGNRNWAGEETNGAGRAVCLSETASMAARAERFDVSPGSVKRAQRVFKASADDPEAREMVEQIEKGTLSVTTADERIKKKQATVIEPPPAPAKKPRVGSIESIAMLLLEKLNFEELKEIVSFFQSVPSSALIVKLGNNLRQLNGERA